MEMSNGVTSSLFVSLLREIQRTGGDATDAKQQPEVLSSRTEFLAWWESTATWRTSTKGDGKRDGYMRMYRRLGEIVKPTTHLQRLTDREYASLVKRCARGDWVVDQEQLESLELCSCSLATLALCAKQDAVAIMTALSAPEDAPEAATQAPSSAPLTRRMTMAEKLSHMRSRRSTLISQDSLTSKPTSVEPQTEAQAPTDALDSRISTSDGRSIGRSDEAAHYFAIETRMELKETLKSLQRRLDDLLVQTKLAWMKCFASGSMDTTSDIDASEAMQTATKVVTLGEALAALLLESFSKAKTNCPIYEYKALVLKCEKDWDEYQTLVLQIAAAPSPTRTDSKSIEMHKDEAEPRREHQEDVARSREAPVFDLPSMKSYYEKAALPYAAYLPDKQLKQVPARRRR